jgi:hypothetical protein
MFIVGVESVEQERWLLVGLDTEACLKKKPLQHFKNGGQAIPNHIGNRFMTNRKSL